MQKDINVDVIYRCTWCIVTSISFYAFHIFCHGWILNMALGLLKKYYSINTKPIKWNKTSRQVNDLRIRSSAHSFQMLEKVFVCCVFSISTWKQLLFTAFCWTLCVKRHYDIFLQTSILSPSWELLWFLTGSCSLTHKYEKMFEQKIFYFI